MTNFIKAFAQDENGAVTVDWVVLTAAVVGLAVAAYSSIQTGASYCQIWCLSDPHAAA